MEDSTRVATSVGSQPGVRQKHVACWRARQGHGSGISMRTAEMVGSSPTFGSVTFSGVPLYFCGLNANPKGPPPFLGVPPKADRPICLGKLAILPSGFFHESELQACVGGKTQECTPRTDLWKINLC